MDSEVKVEGFFVYSVNFVIKVRSLGAFYFDFF